MREKSLKHFLLGRPLRSSELSSEKMNFWWGVPIMASDAVSSVAYAIEEILMVLVPVLGMAATGYVNLVAAPIIVLLLVLVFSYSQIIDRYPNGGGAYVVSAQNLGRRTSLVAASALIIDYVMTVAVSLSSATSAILAAFPSLGGYRVPIALLGLCLITLMNLRGIRESSKAFGIPTYAFIVVMAALIVTGFVRFATGSIGPIEYAHVPEAVGEETTGLFILLILKAFSSGCSALTGVEAVSNAVPSFKEPSTRTAKHILYALGGIIIFIFGGSAILARGLHVIPQDGMTVVAQMGAAVFGRGVMFYILQFSTMLILVLAANTAYNGLPTLLAILAQDGYMPRQFSQRGTKLSFSNGILFIFATAGLLLILFQANTHHLIPLYSVGVFLSFTLSQFGMVVLWLRTKEKGWRHKFAINGLGALMTSVSAVIVFGAKMRDGAWLLAIVIPALALLMSGIRRHYDYIREQIRLDDFMALYRPSTSTDRNLCIVLASSLSRPVLKALNYANGISSNVIALHISTDAAYTEKMKARWESMGVDVPLEIIEAPYRDIMEPLEEYINRKESELKHGEDVSVVTIKFVESAWYDNFLHNQTTYFIERLLRMHKHVVTVIVPYIYDDPEARRQRKRELRR